MQYKYKCGIILAVLPSVLFAAPIIRKQDRINEGIRRQEERSRELTQGLSSPTPAPIKKAKADISLRLATETPCFNLQQVSLFGADVQRNFALATALQTQVLDKFVGQCAGVKGVSQIAAAANAWLLNRGYATSSVALPQQNISTGNLNLQLFLGRISEVRFIDAATGKSDQHWGTWRNAFWLRTPDLLNLDDLQQGVEQMNRLPSQHVASKLEPGATPNTSVVIIERQSGTWWQRLHGGLSVDNSGSQALGRTQVSLWSSFDNLLGLNDIINVNANSNAENPDPSHRSQTLSASYSIPLGNSSFSLSYNDNQFAQKVAGTTAEFLSSGESVSGDLRWQYQLVRYSSGKLSLYADVSQRRAHSYLNDVELLVQRRHTVNSELGFNWQQLLGNSNLSLSYGYRQGRNWFGAEPDYPSEAQLTLRPNISTLDVALDAPFQIAQHRWQFSSSIHGQYTKDRTISNDQISIGNRYSVRGFDGDNVLLAESGGYWRNELSSALPSFANTSLQGYWAVDAGRVWGASAPNLVGQNLAGSAIGLRFAWNSLRTDVSVGKPLYKPKGFKTSDWSLYASLTASF